MGNDQRPIFGNGRRSAVICPDHQEILRGKVIMLEYSIAIRRIVKWTIFVLAGAVVGWGFSSNPTMYAGFVLGITCGLISTIFTAWKINRVGEVAAAYSEGQKKQASLGMPTRFGLAALATLICLKYPQHFHLPVMVIGLMVPTVIAFIDMFYCNLTQKHQNADEGGE